jgi:hypothetical protein
VLDAHVRRDGCLIQVRREAFLQSDVWCATYGCLGGLAVSGSSDKLGFWPWLRRGMQPRMCKNLCRWVMLTGSCKELTGLRTYSRISIIPSPAAVDMARSIRPRAASDAGGRHVAVNMLHTPPNRRLQARPLATSAPADPNRAMVSVNWYAAVAGLTPGHPRHQPVDIRLSPAAEKRTARLKAWIIRMQAKTCMYVRPRGKACTHVQAECEPSVTMTLLTHRAHESATLSENTTGC